MAVRDRYAKRRSDRSTFSFHLERTSMAEVERLVANGVFENKSHAVDEALRLLLMVHAARLVDQPESVPA